MPSVLIEKVEPGITTITLNRPDRLNAISYDLVCELHDALDVIGGDYVDRNLQAVASPSARSWFSPVRAAASAPGST